MSAVVGWPDLPGMATSRSGRFATCHPTRPATSPARSPFGDTGPRWCAECDPAALEVPAFLAWGLPGNGTAVVKVWSVSANGWLLESADGYTELHDDRPRGSWAASDEESARWWSRRRPAPVAYD